MSEGHALTVRAKHRLGSFQLDVDFTVERWPALLFGPSGAGKSTLLRIIAGLERPDDARVSLGPRLLIDTQQRVHQRPGAGGVQLVTQRAALFPHLTVRQNVAFGLRGLSPSERDSRVDTLLAILHAEQLVNRRPDHLSGGERQRVVLARALAPRPNLLLLDEAFIGLDGELKQEILTDLNGLLEQSGTLALHVTHEVSDAYALNAEIIVLQEGEVVAQGPASTVLAKERDSILATLNPKLSP
jgi:ABC-type sulfate/molybdate transport systems ATPase subunit